MQRRQSQGRRRWPLTYDVYVDVGIDMATLEAMLASMPMLMLLLL